MTLAPSVKQNLYRFVQETIENVVLHAIAKHLLVGLVVNQIKLSLSVQVGGSCLVPTEVSGHNGLSGMRHQLALRSVPGKYGPEFVKSAELQSLPDKWQPIPNFNS